MRSVQLTHTYTVIWKIMIAMQCYFDITRKSIGNKEIQSRTLLRSVSKPLRSHTKKMWPARDHTKPFVIYLQKNQVIGYLNRQWG